MSGENAYRNGSRRSGGAVRFGHFMLGGILFWAVGAGTASAHVLPYFSWFRVERQIVVSASELRVTHTCLFDHRVLPADDPLVDSDGDSTASQHELADICALTARYLAQDFVAIVSTRPAPANLESFAMVDRDAGFRTEMVVALPEPQGRLPVTFLDPAYLFPRPVPLPADEPTAAVASRTDGEGISLLDESGTMVQDLEHKPFFRTDLVIHMPLSPEATSPVTSSTSLLSPIHPTQAPIKEAIR